MANIFEWGVNGASTKEELDEWLKDRPEKIREMAASHPPNKLYRLNPTNQRVFLDAYAEDGTVTVVITGDFNLVAMPSKVFGILLSDLTECDLPGEDEVLGVWMDESMQLDHVNSRRAENGLRPLTKEELDALKC